MAGMPPMRSSLGVVPRLVRRPRTRGAALGTTFFDCSGSFFTAAFRSALGGASRWGRLGGGWAGRSALHRVAFGSLLKVFGVLRAMPTHELIGETRLSRLVLGRADFVSDARADGVLAKHSSRAALPLWRMWASFSLATVVLRSSSDMASNAFLSLGAGASSNGSSVFKYAPRFRITVSRTTFGPSGGV